MIFRPNRSIAVLVGLLTLAAGTGWSDAAGQPAADPDAPLSGMVAVVFRDSGPTTADNLSDYLKQLVALYNTDRARLRGIRFPLENATSDTVRVLDGLRHNVVVKWLDPLTFADGPAAPRFGANADFLAYFGDGWNADWPAGGIGSPPQFSGSGTSGWVWSNHEYVSNQAPTPTSAPTGQHLTLARFLRAAGVLANDVESDLWAQRDVDAYIRQEKRQVGGSWFHVVQDEGTGAWHLDRDAPNRRYDATGATRLLVTGTTLSGLDHDDAGLYLPTGVVVGIMGDCSGCVTPWGTVITAEENVQDYYGDLEAAFPSSNNKFVAGAGFDPGADLDPVMTASTSADFGRISDPDGRHRRDAYGYLSEIDPGLPSQASLIGGAGHQKLGAVGRARWENASIVTDGSFKLIAGQPVVMYAANDRRGGRVYKWVSERAYRSGMSKAEVRELLVAGRTYVSHLADLDNATGYLHVNGRALDDGNRGRGRWIWMSLDNTADTAPNAAALDRPDMTVGAALRDVHWNGIGGFPSDVLVRAALFTAAAKIGVREQNRPEDVEWNPLDPSGTPRLYVAFTKHGRPNVLRADGTLNAGDAERPIRDDSLGRIFVLEEDDPARPGRSAGFSFWQVWEGTEETGPFDAANPDNLAIDRDGGVWFGTDGNYGRNGTADALYYLDLNPAHATYGTAFRFAAGPADSEATGPAFNATMTTLFFNVQHPGEDFEGAPSTWPQR